MILFIVNTLKSSLHNIKCNQQAFVMSVITISIAFSILGLFFLIFVNLNSLLSTWDKHVQVIVYLEDGISKSNLSKLKYRFASNKEIISVTFVSKDDAWEEFQSTFSKNSEFIKVLDLNPLPASYILKFADNANRLKNIRKFVATLVNVDGVESLEYGEKWISSFEKFMFFFRGFILLIGGLLSVGLILIISNTIKISIFIRKNEIDLMLLLGATYRFIKAPLLIEGLVHGIIGMFISLSIVKLIHIYILYQFQGSLESIFRGIEVQFLTTHIIIGMIIASCAIGLIGSLISINQYLYARDQR